MTKKSIKLISILLSAVLLLASIGTIGAAAEAPDYTADAPKVGIDVSEHQGEIDWSKVKDEVDFAMIRVGCTYYGSLAFHVDDYFVKNVEGATAAGIPIGIYYFGCATSTEMAVEEAEFVLEQLKNYPAAFSYPIVYDIEVSSSMNSAVPPVATQATKAFCDTIRAAGYYPMVYSFINYIDNNIATADISNNDFWLAHFTCPSGLKPSQFVDNAGERKSILPSVNGKSYDSNTSIWQCTDKASVSGISGAVDGNICYFDYESFIKNEGYNGFTKAAGDNRTAVCTGSSVNIRSGASTAFTAIGAAVEGDEFEINRFYNKSWLEIKYNDHLAYVHADYFDIVENDEDIKDEDSDVDNGEGEDKVTEDESINTDNAPVDELPEEELTVWQKIARFFANIFNFFKNLFTK